uniref:Uncharacterized protein n=1 Tax=Ditylenchus dipsaci TaxID=166011 RepID=A0A915D4U0_9BILA
MKLFEADETKAAKRAVMALYRMAIRDVSSALNIRTANCPQSKAREIEGQRQKLESHLKLTQGRMADLGKLFLSFMTPRKPLNEIGRTASLSRIEGIASAFRGNKNRALSFKEYEEASRKVRRRLGILSPAREANETMPKLTPLEDFKICAGRFNGKERRYLKSDLQKINKDFLAPTDKVCALKKKLSSILQVQSSVEKEIPTVWLNNVPEVLSDRLNRLHENASKVLLREDADYPLRTLWSIENGSLSYVFSGGDSLPAKDKAALRRKVCSIVKEPLIQVPPSNIVPPSLHLIQGLAQKLIEWIEEVDEALVPALETIYKELGADKQAWYQTFTGNHVKKILSGVGPEKIANVISGHPIHSTFRKLLSLLGKMQCLAKSAFLSDEEIGQFEGWSEDYFRCMKVILGLLGL